MLEMLFRDMENKKAIGSSQYGFKKGKSYLTNLITFSNKLNRLAVEGRAVDIANLSEEHFDIVSHRVFIWKLMKNRLDETVNQAQNSLNIQAQRVVISYEAWLEVSSKQCTSEEDRVRLFSVVLCDGRRGNMRKLKPGRLSGDQEPLFHCKGGVTEHWSRLPRELIESRSVETSKTWLGSSGGVTADSHNSVTLNIYIKRRSAVGKELLGILWPQRVTSRRFSFSHLGSCLEYNVSFLLKSREKC